MGAPNRLIFYEFVPCNIRTVLDRSFLKFVLKISKIFASTNFSKIDLKGYFFIWLSVGRLISTFVYQRFLGFDVVINVQKYASST